MKLSRAGYEPTKRRFFLGPGIITAVVIATALVASGRLQLSKPPPKPELTALQLSDSEKLGPMPQVSWLVAHSRALKLTPAQDKKLKDLAVVSDAEMKPLKTELDKAGQDFEQWVRTHSARKGERLSVQQGAGELVLLSRKAAEIRQKRWKQATMLLSAAQRKQVDSMREAEFNASLKKLQILQEESK